VSHNAPEQRVAPLTPHAALRRLDAHFAQDVEYKSQALSEALDRLRALVIEGE
jgi:hypothetical protein